MKSKTTTQLLLTRPEAATVLAISERTLFSLTKDGTIPAVKLGHSVRYRMSDIEAALDRLQSGSADKSVVG